jgi:hypothetical protein
MSDYPKHAVRELAPACVLIRGAASCASASAQAVSAGRQPSRAVGAAQFEGVVRGGLAQGAVIGAQATSGQNRTCVRDIYVKSGAHAFKGTRALFGVDDRFERCVARSWLDTRGAGPEWHNHNANSTKAIGAGHRRKLDNRAFAREPKGYDVFVAWQPNKYVSLTVAYA